MKLYKDLPGPFLRAIIKLGNNLNNYVDDTLKSINTA
jgi:hypothetical protein